MHDALRMKKLYAALGRQKLLLEFIKNELTEAAEKAKKFNKEPLEVHTGAFCVDLMYRISQYKEELENKGINLPKETP